MIWQGKICAGILYLYIRMADIFHKVGKEAWVLTTSYIPLCYLTPTTHKKFAHKVSARFIYTYFFRTYYTRWHKTCILNYFSKIIVHFRELCVFLLLWIGCYVCIFCYIKYYSTTDKCDILPHGCTRFLFKFVCLECYGCNFYSIPISCWLFKKTNK